MLVLLPCGQEVGITGTAAAAWNDNCLGHGGYSRPGEEGEGKRRVERGREREMLSRLQACPYFALRGIKEEAHIVFCPYNYLIDPLIRDQVSPPPLSLSISPFSSPFSLSVLHQMLIELTGQVVVFDEAHNMEDAAREASSLSLTSFQLEDLVKEFTDICESIARQPSKPDTIFVTTICQNVA